MTNVFSAPVTLQAIEALTPEDTSLLRLSGNALTAVTQLLVGSTAPTSPIPAYETVGVIVAATLQNFAGTDANKVIVTEIIRRQAAQAEQAR